MSKRLISLNLAILLLLTFLLGSGFAPDSDSEDTFSSSVGSWYAYFYGSEDSEGQLKELRIIPGSSGADLMLYQVSPLENANQRVITSYKDKNSHETYRLSAPVLDTFGQSEADAPELMAVYSSIASPAVLFVSPEVSANGMDYLTISGAGSHSAPDGTDFGIRDGSLAAWRVGNDYIVAGESFEMPNGISYATAILGEAYIIYRDIRIFGAGDEISDYVRVYDGNTVLAESCDGENDVFLGWQGGDGTWYPADTSVLDAPNELFARYEKLPDGRYYILRSDSGLAGSGQTADVIETTNGLVRLPDTLYDGSKVIYWHDISFSGKTVSYPAGRMVTVADGAELTPVTAINDKVIYGVFHGDGGRVNEESDYCVTCAGQYTGYTSQGDLVTYTHNGPLYSIGRFMKDGSALVGFKGESGEIYDLNDMTLDVFFKEGKAGDVIDFTAVYEQQDWPFVQYMGCGAVTSDGSAYSIAPAEETGSNRSFTVAENMFATPEGRVFLGWNTSISGDGDWYDPGDSAEFRFDNSVLLYAQWGETEGEHRINFHFTSDGIPVTDTNVSGKVGRLPYYADNCDFFSGWNTAEDGSGDWYHPGQKLPDTVPTQIDLYAQFVTPIKGMGYCLLERDEHGKPILELLEFEGETASVTFPGGTRYGWVKSGVSVSLNGVYLDETQSVLDKNGVIPNGGTATVTSGDRYKPLNLYYYSIGLHINLNGGSLSVPIEAEKDGSIDLRNYVPEREGFIFGGWYLNAELTEPVSKLEADEGVTVYAKWAAVDSLPLADVAVDAWYYDAVSGALAIGLMDGAGETSFEPDAAMNRAMVWTVLARMDGKAVTGSAWAESAREWAEADGVSDGENPSAVVTREQLATLLYLCAGKPEVSGTLAAWSDASSVSEWAVAGIIWAVENGIITGDTATTLNPQGNATRAECAAILMRYAAL